MVDGGYVARMEDGLDLYAEKADPKPLRPYSTGIAGGTLTAFARSCASTKARPS